MITNAVWLFVLVTLSVVRSNEEQHKEWDKTQVISKTGIERKFTSTSTTFVDMIHESSIWIDKSLLIKHIWELEGSLSENVVYITGPPRWGKTMNLGMFGFHAGMVYDKHGNSKRPEETDSYKYFVEGIVMDMDEEGQIPQMKLDKKPLISLCSRTRLHLAKHPVIYLNGKILDIYKGANSIRSMIQNAFLQHTRVLSKLTALCHNPNNPTRIKDCVNLQLFSTYIDPKWETTIASENSTLQRSIARLSKILFDTYGENVVILYDEYDSFVHEYFDPTPLLFTSTDSALFLKELKSFMLSTFKTNTYLTRGIITGVCSVRQATYLSGLTNLYRAQVFDRKDLYPFYGTFQPEFEMLVKAANVPENIIDDAILFYEGYRSLSHPEVPLFSTFSVMGFLKEYKIESYHLNKVVPPLLENLMQNSEFQKDMAVLTQNYLNPDAQLFNISYDKFVYLELTDCEILRKLNNGELRYESEKHKDIAFSLLICSGYIALVSAETEQRLNIRIPNAEIYNDLSVKFRNSMGLSNKKRDISCDYISAYVESENDTTTLPGLVEVISKKLIVDSGHELGFGNFDKSATAVSELIKDGKNELGTEAAIEMYIKVMFKNALEPRAKNFTGISKLKKLVIAQQLKRGFTSMPNMRLDLLFLVENTTALTIEVKYNKTACTNISAPFCQSLDYSYFFKDLSLENYVQYKFLAVCADENGNVEAMSVTLSPISLQDGLNFCDRNIKEIDEKNPEKSEIKKKNRETWGKCMFEYVFKRSAPVSFRHNRQSNSNIRLPLSLPTESIIHLTEATTETTALTFTSSQASVQQTTNNPKVSETSSHEAADGGFEKSTEIHAYTQSIKDTHLSPQPLTVGVSPYDTDKTVRYTERSGPYKTRKPVKYMKRRRTVDVNKPKLRALR